jgi:hypothetical protein
MEYVLALLGIIALVMVYAAVARPGGPDPNNPQQAPQAMREAGCGLVAVAIIVVAIFAVVLAG